MKEKVKVEKFISKTNLKKLLNRLLKDTCLVAPLKISGEIIFQEVESVDDIIFDYQNCLNAPKDYALLNDEVLFRYDLKRQKVKKNNLTFPEIIIFGSRACDTKAMGLLDKFFLRDLKDPLYFKKRDNLFIITVVCNKLDQNCFCTSTNSGPYLEEEFDLQLIDIGDGYFLEAYSTKGKSFVKRFSDLIGKINLEQRKRKEEAIKKSVSSKNKEFNLDKLYNNLDKVNTKEELWQELGQRCQSCGGCLLICPSCSCFYVVDKKINNREGQRVRSLDTCYYKGSTRMAGGYNPIASKEMMMRRKFYHKLWQQINEFGQSGCTGCGRCNDICPGNINWLETIKKIEGQSGDQ